jgi:Tat protein secretion system quality control protein TatD with DNase activity
MTTIIPDAHSLFPTTTTATTTTTNKQFFLHHDNFDSIPTHICGTNPIPDITTLLNHNMLLENNTKNNIVKFSLGLHPWMVPLLKNDSILSSLKETLSLYPFVHVGEIGLDRVHAKRFKIPLVPNQVEMFHQQLQMAFQFNRRVTIHCVQAHGHLIQILKQTILEYPNTTSIIYLHAFTGSKETVRDLLHLAETYSLTLYFGFCIRHCNDNIELFRKELSPNQILIESDLPINDPNRMETLQASFDVFKDILTLEQVEKNWTRIFQ